MKKIFFFLLIILPLFVFGQYNSTYYSSDKLPEADYFVLTKYKDNSGSLYFQVGVFKDEKLIWLFDNLYKYIQTQDSFVFYVNNIPQTLFNSKPCLPIYKTNKFKSCDKCSYSSIVYTSTYNIENGNLEVFGFISDGLVNQSYVSNVFIYTDFGLHIWVDKIMYTFTND